MGKRPFAAALAMLFILGLAGCAQSEPRQTITPPVETPSPTSVATPAPTSTPGSVACLAIDASDLLAAEVGVANFHDIVYGDTRRKYVLYIPEGLGEGAPLVFVLHGYYGQAFNFMQKTGMNDIADAHGFAVVYPQGLPAQSGEFPGSHWNADFTFTDEDDVGFLAALAANLQQTYGFSKEHTFATGLSNGGFMCYTLAVKSPGTFRAIAPVAGLMSKGTWEDRDVTSEPTPILHIHGTADPTVPIDGTMMPSGGWGGAPELDETIRYWAERDGLDVMTEETSGNLYRRVYSSDGSEDLIWYYLIDGFDHNWPTVENAGLDTGEFIWQFFSNYLDR